jgi:hypothetical protein
MSELLSARQQGKLQGKLRLVRQFLPHGGAKLSVRAVVIRNLPHLSGASKQGLTGNATLQRFKKA